MKARKKRPDLTGQHTRTYANPHAYTIMMNYPPRCVSPVPHLISSYLISSLSLHKCLHTQCFHIYLFICCS